MKLEHGREMNQLDFGSDLNLGYFSSFQDCEIEHFPTSSSQSNP